jgi:hypothetical protein
VIAHCAKAGILWQGLFHDLSKYSPTEFLPGVRFFDGTHSPTEDERRTYGCSQAWMHHKGRNRHHLEYWNDLNPATKRYEPVKMPIRFVKEMFCDRVAASKIYQGKNYTDAHPFNYFDRGNARLYLHPETAALLEKCLIMLRDEGEKKTFRFIKGLKEY